MKRRDGTHQKQNTRTILNTRCLNFRIKYPSSGQKKRNRKTDKYKDLKLHEKRKKEKKKKERKKKRESPPCV